MKYTEALAELERIMEDLREGRVDIDQLEVRTARAGELIAWCRQQLRGVEDRLQDLNDPTGDEFRKP